MGAPGGGGSGCACWRRRQRLRRSRRGLLLFGRLLPLRPLRCRRRNSFRRGRDRRLLRAFAVGEPHVVDRMLDRVQAGARGEHPAGEHALDLALQRDLVRLDEGVGIRRLGHGPRVAGARRHLQRAELHRLVDRHIERDDAAGDLVEAGEHRGGVRDFLRRRRNHHFLVLRRRCGRSRGLGRRAGRRCAPWLPLSRRRRGPAGRGRQVLLLDAGRARGLLRISRRRRIPRSGGTPCCG